MKLWIFILALTLITSCVGSMDDIHNQVAQDSIKSYELSKKGGDKIEICVHAGIVVAAFNQAHDEQNYLAWKEIEKADCLVAGIPK